MKSNPSKRNRVAQILLGVAVVATLVLARDVKAGEDHDHMVTDWSHRHLVFSEPHSLMKRFQLSTDVRYLQQVRRDKAERRGIGREEWRWHHAPENPHRIKGDWSMDMGAGATVGAGNYPAKFSFGISTSNCATPPPPVGQQPDFVVYNTSLAGTGSQATIVAFDNLYTGTCTGTTPQTYWAYNTGTPGAVVTSPVLSFDGTQVAFIQNAGSGANLVVLRWKANDGTLIAPVTPGVGPCLPAAAPCQSTVALSTATVTYNGNTTTCSGTDTHSSPFYDYGQDVIYVGDNTGCLHKFTGVFLGTPTEVISTGADVWPAGLTGNFGYLASPVSIPQGATTPAMVLVTGSDGELYAVDPTVGGVYPNGADFIDPKLADAGFEDGPLVDPTSGMIYLFARQASTFVTVANGVPNGVPSVTSIFQVAIPTSVAAIHTPTIFQAVVSDSATIPASAFYLGAFDFDYYNSGGTGNLYACGTHNTVNAIWQIPIFSDVMNPPILGPSITSADVGCSPITEIDNGDGSTWRIFMGVTASPVNCPPNTSGCIMSFDVTNANVWSPANTPAAVTPVTGGTSGIVIDDILAILGTSQIYFTPLADQACAGSGGVGNGTGGCAIQASQSGLN